MESQKFTVTVLFGLLIKMNARHQCFRLLLTVEAQKNGKKSWQMTKIIVFSIFLNIALF